MDDGSRRCGTGVGLGGSARPAAGRVHVYRLERQDRLLAELPAAEYERADERQHAAAEPGSSAGRQCGEELSLSGRTGES